MKDKSCWTESSARLKIAATVRRVADKIGRVPLGLIVFVLLVPWIALGAIILTALNAHQRDSLIRAAETRAIIAASILEQQIMGLIHTVATVSNASPAAINIAELSAVAGGSIRVLNLKAALALSEPPQAFAGATKVASDVSESPAARALSSKTPQVSTFRGEDPADSGIDVWLPLKNDAADAAVLQIHLTSSHLSKLLGGFVSDDHWSLALAGQDGHVFTQFGMKSDWSGEQAAPSFARAFSKPSEFGLRVGAATSLSKIESDAQRNWGRFLVVTCLLGAATLAAGKTLTQRNLRTLDEQPLNRRRSHAPTSTALNEKRLRLALTAAGQSAWAWDIMSRNISWDDSGGRKLLRLSPDAPDPSPIQLLRRLPPRDRQRLLGAVGKSLQNSQSFNLQVAMRCFDGSARWLDIHASPEKDKDGQISRLVGVVADVTDQKKNLSRTDSLLREISHRSKNLLALILAMARLTARDAVDIQAHVKDFTLRVAGIAASQDLIVAADWHNVDLRTLASAQVEAVARADASRVKITGPTFLLVPEAAQTLGMILTELALNAVQHGALSVAAGEVHLSWSFPTPATIKIVWSEMGGPEFESRRPKGYGRSVIERFSTQGLKFKSSLRTGPTSLKWSLAGSTGNIGMVPVSQDPPSQV